MDSYSILKIAEEKRFVTFNKMNFKSFEVVYMNMTAAIITAARLALGM